MRWCVGFFFVLFSTAIWSSGAPKAHESRPLYVEIAEQEGGDATLRWKTPPSVPAFNIPDLHLTGGCSRATPQAPVRAPSPLVRERDFVCPGGLGGQVLSLDYPRFNPSVTTLVRIVRKTGESETILASPSETRIALPSAITTGGVAAQYLSLGIAHIATGYDHLLFLACLMFIARTARRIVYTVTGFTLAHSLTLALAALGIVHVPSPPVEAAIALSIVFVASEIARARHTTLTWRYPIAVSSSFGLLHGLGFASVLGEIGLPQGEIVPALLFFNLGVEVGQLAFVVIVVLAGYALRAMLSRRPDGAGGTQSGLAARLQIPTAYIVGGLASFWMIERLYGFVG